MNYGYPSLGRKIDEVLANRLRPFVLKAASGLPEHEAPYVEVDGLYEGVRIRKITHLDDATWDTLLTNADQTHEEVCAEYGIELPPLEK